MQIGPVDNPTVCVCLCAGTGEALNLGEIAEKHYDAPSA